MQGDYSASGPKLSSTVAQKSVKVGTFQQKGVLSDKLLAPSASRILEDTKETPRPIITCNSQGFGQSRMIAKLDADYICTRPARAVARVVSHVLLQGRPLTTRWRWLNPLLFAQFALVKRLPQLGKVQKPIFIVGVGRSGTTILGHVLSIHPQVGFLKEPKALWHPVYPEEDLIGSYSHGPARYRLGTDDATMEVRRAAHRLYGYYSALTGSKRIVDKYPEMIFRTPFIRAIFPDAKFLFLVRNGWDTVQSIECWSQRNGTTMEGELHDWWGVNSRKWRLLLEQIVASDPTFSNIYNDGLDFSRHTDRAAVEWIATMNEGLRLMKENPRQFHMVRYEDMTAYPEETLMEVLRFCELPPDKSFFAYASRVLQPIPSRYPVNLDPSLRPIFAATMESLGYAPNIVVASLDGKKSEEVESDDSRQGNLA